MAIGFRTAAAGCFTSTRVACIVSVQPDHLTVDNGRHARALRRHRGCCRAASRDTVSRPLQEWADGSAMIGEEIVTRPSPRIRRRFSECNE
jgi:hypothetical protein